MSIINNTHEFIFVHIPKTGGTSISSGLTCLNGLFDLELGATKFGESIAPFYSKKFGIGKHTTAWKIKNILGKKVFNRYYSFAVVRNPYYRTLSTYTFLKTWRNWEKSSIMDSFQNFSDFIYSDFFESNGPDNILREQLYWINDPIGNSLINDIYKFENIEDIIPSIFKKIGKPKDFKIEYNKRLNTSRKKKEDFHTLEHDEKIRQIIYDKYIVDFEKFNYKK